MLQNSQIEIINHLGQLVLKTELANKVDVSELAQGIYTLKVVTKDKRNRFSKFVKD